VTFKIFLGNCLTCLCLFTRNYEILIINYDKLLIFNYILLLKIVQRPFNLIITHSQLYSIKFKKNINSIKKKKIFT